MRRPVSLSLLCVAAAVALLAVRETSLWPDGALHLHVLDVGQGTSVLLASPSGKQILIDGGPGLPALERLGAHLPFLDRTIDLVVLTHPESDHVTALAEVLRRYKVERVLLTGVRHELGRYDALLHEIETRGTRVLFPDPGRDIAIGDGLVLDVVWPRGSPPGGTVRGVNDTSIVLRALWKEHAILLPGDIEGDAERAILATGADIRADVLLVPHHGSETSSTDAFIRAVRPALAIVSAGRDNPHGHPHPRVLERYAALGIPVRSTAEDGTVTVVFK